MAASDVLPAKPFPPPADKRAEGTAFLGMVIFMSSWAMLFAGLFFAYGLIRSRALAWPPMDLPRLPLRLPALATLTLVISSAFLQGALDGVRRGWVAARQARTLLVAAALAGVFLLLQGIVWREVFLAGLIPQSGAYASVFFGLTVFHAVHVLVGLFALTWLAIQAGRGRYTPAQHIPVRLWTLYWHMVGIIWAVMFAVLYVL